MDTTTIEVPEDLTTLDPDALGALEGQLREGAFALAEGEDVEAIEAAADALDRLVAERGRREQVAAEVKAKRDAALARVAASAPKVEDAKEEEPVKELVTAAAAPVRIDVPAARARQEATREVEQVVKPTVALVASASGVDVAGLRGLTDTFNRALQSNKAVDTKVVVASADYRTAAQFRIGAGDDAGEVLAEVRMAADGMRALTAAGQPCGLTEAHWSPFICSERGTPIWDSLPRVVTDRGKHQWLPAPTLADMRAGVAIIECDSTGDKPVATFDCQDTIDICVGAISARLKVTNWVAKFNPEQTSAAVEVLNTVRDEMTEQAAFAALVANSTPVNGFAHYGANSSLLSMLLAAARQLRGSARSMRRVIVWLPVEAMYALGSDVVAQENGGNGSLGQIEGFLSRFNIEVVWSFPGDLITAPTLAPGATLPGNCITGGTFVVGFAGSFAGISGGTIDTGFYRDSTLNTSNCVELFSEEFLTVAKLGCGSLAVTFDLVDTGEFAPHAAAPVSTCP